MPQVEQDLLEPGIPDVHHVVELDVHHERIPDGAVHMGSRAEVAFLLLDFRHMKVADQLLEVELLIEVWPGLLEHGLGH